MQFVSPEVFAETRMTGAGETEFGNAFAGPFYTSLADKQGLAGTVLLQEGSKKAVCADSPPPLAGLGEYVT